MDGLSISDLKSVVWLACRDIGALSDNAVNLVTGTFLAESGALALFQRGGPALGLGQMEPATHDDRWANYIMFNADLKSRMLAMAGGHPTAARMVFDIRYAAAMTRIRYLPDPQPIPSDAEGQADYHKRVYNTVLGAAVASQNVPLFARAIAAPLPDIITLQNRWKDV